MSPLFEKINNQDDGDNPETKTKNNNACPDKYKIPSKLGFH